MKDAIFSTQSFYNLAVKKGILKGAAIGMDGIMGEVETIPAMKAIYNYFYQSAEMVKYQPLLGIRTSDVFTDMATDWILIPYQNMCYVVPASTKAGWFRVFTPEWIDGVFGVGVVVPGFYVNVWKLVTGKNHSLLWSGAPYGHQIGAPFNYVRDGDKNNTITYGKVYSGYKGFNLHTYKNWNKNWVWKLVDKIFNISTGCQVIPYYHFMDILPILEALAAKNNGFLSYCLTKNFSLSPL